ncbi:hypothetical protein [Micromonospora sp. HM5-17]|uniref:hypothetical protein n=1 Tax=Micromonospora sp. HM5-17 TaxID=2487710 RepID=UPI000F4611E9|nr:hypothetical protein [Micromonospora sp. HM5-17]ROT32046.1 hypothetical protein EF879_10510 [Micromonospora sp. HM5-17]
MSVSPQASEVPEAPAGLRVRYGGAMHPAEELARGAAYELFSQEPVDGFLRDTRPTARYPWHRYVHTSEVGRPPGTADPESPLMVPLNRELTWRDVHELSQTPAAADHPLLAAVRRSAVIRRGTPMVKALSAYQLTGYLLRGWLPYGFCYREYDVAHLRTPADQTLLRTDGEAGRAVPEVAYLLRWRATDPIDYVLPAGPEHRGLLRIPSHDRVGPPVLGTGFTPSGRHLIPEFVTRDFADLPLPANAALLAHTSDGDEVVLYTYQPEQRGWLRMVGPRWRHLLAGIPGISPDQEYVSTAEAPRSTVLIGTYRGQEHEAVADPPDEFRVLARTRAARYPVETLVRLARYVTWRGARCLVLREESGWLRVRLCRPDPDSVAALGAQCYERGVYEAWAPAAETTDDGLRDVAYPR